MIPEELDLQDVVETLRTHLGPSEVLGYLRGKALLRDVLVRTRRYSELEAEEVIDTLEDRGFLHFEGDPAARSRADAHWQIRSSPAGG
jgi:hypothetical protein